MKISELNKKIDICTKIGNNGPVDDLEPMYETIITSIWAKKINLLGKESIKLGLEHNTVQVNFIVRARGDIDDDMYIKHKNVIYNIVGINEIKDDINYMLIATVKK